MKITINVTDDDFESTNLLNNTIYHKAEVAYEAEKNKIRPGDWVIKWHSAEYRSYIYKFNHRIGNDNFAKKLSQPLQDMLNAEIK